MRFVDLSHTIESGMVTYPGLPEPQIRDWLTREASRERYGGQAEFQIGRIDMIANTGTYLDTPFHRYPDGGDLADLPLTSVANLPGVLTDGRNLDELDVRGRAVLVHTGWSQHWRTETYGDPTHPFVSKEAAELLVRKGAALVGIDCVNIDAATDLSRPAHDPPARRHPDRRAPHEPRRARGQGVHLLRGAGEGPRDGHVPGARVCDGVTVERRGLTPPSPSAPLRSRVTASAAARDPSSIRAPGR